MDGDFVDPAAFRLRKESAGFEDGLSVNWYEYFQKQSPIESIAPLRTILQKNGRTIGKTSRFALLNVGVAIEVAAEYTQIQVVADGDDQDPSHAIVTGYEAYNDEVSEALAKVVIAAIPAYST
jgi:hypothetical protein